MYKIGQPISRIDFYRLAPLGLEAKYNGSTDVKIYSTKAKKLMLQIGSCNHDFNGFRKSIETDLNNGSFLISKLPNYPLLKRKPNV